MPILKVMSNIWFRVKTLTLIPKIFVTLTVVLGVTSCATSPENGTGVSRAVNSIRARLVSYRPPFLQLKTSTELGFRALIMKDYDKAAWHLEYEVKNNPDQPEARLYLGRLYEESGSSDQASAMYQAAAQSNSGALIKSDPALRGRSVAEVASARLALLRGNSEIVKLQEQMTVANTPPNQRQHDDLMAGALVPNAFPANPPAPSLLALSDKATTPPADEPETVIIGVSPTTTPAGKIPSAMTTAAHLASYKRRRDAERGWNILTTKYPELNSYERIIVEADLGPVKGIYYRLVANGIRSRGQARELCRSLKNQGHDWCQIGEVSD